MSSLPFETDELSALREKQSDGITAAWLELIRTLRELLAQQTVDHLLPIWLDHVTGRRGDAYQNTSRNAFHQPGFLLWAFVRHELSQYLELPLRQRLESTIPAKLLSNLVDTETLFLQVPTAIEQWASPSVGNAEALIRGHFAACRVVCLAIQLAHDPVRHSNFRRQLESAISAYCNFWATTELPPASTGWFSSSPHSKVDCDADQYSAAHLVTRLMAQCRVARHDARQAFRPSVAVDIAFCMLRRAIRWLLGTEATSFRDAVRTLILLDGPTASCAWLELRSMPDEIGSLCAFPDPIRLGVLPFGETWRTSFQAAIDCVDHLLPTDADTSWCWHIHYPDGALAASLAPVEQQRYVQRPLEQLGPSASASLALLLYRTTRRLPTSRHVAVSAQITPEGTLRPVHLIGKLSDDRLWDRYLRSRIKQLVVCAADHIEVDKWVDDLASRFGRRNFIARADTLGKVNEFVTLQERAATRRTLLASGLGVVTSGCAVAAWTFPHAPVDRSLKSPAPPDERTTDSLPPLRLPLGIWRGRSVSLFTNVTQRGFFPITMEIVESSAGSFTAKIAGNHDESRTLLGTVALDGIRWRRTDRQLLPGQNSYEVCGGILDRRLIMWSVGRMSSDPARPTTNMMKLEPAAYMIDSLPSRTAFALPSQFPVDEGIPDPPREGFLNIVAGTRGTGTMKRLFATHEQEDYPSVTLEFTRRDRDEFEATWYDEHSRCFLRGNIHENQLHWSQATTVTERGPAWKLFSRGEIRGGRLTIWDYGQTEGGMPTVGLTELNLR